MQVPEVPRRTQSSNHHLRRRNTFPLQQLLRHGQAFVQLLQIPFLLSVP
jgi:hypothetical protein